MSKSSAFRTGIFTVAVLVIFLLVASVSAATLNATIDFEGLTEGQTVSTLSVGNGISGDAIPGSVSVVGHNPNRPGIANAAMIFDATCTPTATGGDFDLCDATKQNVLIVTHDGDSSDPDDADVIGSYLHFNYSGFGPGAVTVESIDVGDIEANEGEDAIITLTLSDNSTVNIGPFVTGDSIYQTIAVNVDNVVEMRVTINGSGAIDNVKVSVEEEDENGGGEGCTPGYWKQPHHLDSWVGYSPGDDYETVFGVDASFTATLQEAVGMGGGGEKALARHAVAALLNASNPDVSYAFSTAEVIAEVQAAYASGDYETAKNLFEEQNETFCPLN